MKRPKTPRASRPSLFPYALASDLPLRHPLPKPVPGLRFSPLAWLKLQFLCHAGETEVGGFGISAVDDPLHIERVETVMQGTSAVSVEFSDSAVADHFDRCLDLGIHAARCGRIWIHTHPGDSPAPSFVDEETFARVFGPCDWALMFILSRTGRTYARLRYGKEPDSSLLLPVSVDWSQWPASLDTETEDLGELCRLWRHEYEMNVYDLSAMGCWNTLDRQQALAYWDAMDPQELAEFDRVVGQDKAPADSLSTAWPWNGDALSVPQGGGHGEH